MIVNTNAGRGTWVGEMSDGRGSSSVDVSKALKMPSATRRGVRIRSLVWRSVACALVGLALGVATAYGEEPAALGGSAGSPLGSQLVVPGAQPLLGGEAASDAEEAMQASPELAVAREQSQTEYESLSSSQAAQLARSTFPAMIDEPAGGPPVLPEGQRIHDFINADTAQVEFGEGQRGVIESSAPMAVTSSSGWSPVDLGVREANGVLVPANPLLAVQVPKRLADGVRLPEQGLSLTPIDGSGSPLSGSEGTVDGASVFFANTQTDSDTTVRFTTFGFQINTLLRSAASPQQLSFDVGMPVGATLAREAASGAVRVVKEGATLATIPAPTAHDAAGAVVPVSVGVSGRTLTLSVASHTGEFLYPIAVDPEFNVTTETTLPNHNWKFAESGGGFSWGESSNKHEMWIDHNTEYAAGQRGELYYKTNGDSRLYEIKTSSAVGPTTTGSYWWAEARAYLEFEGSGGEEGSTTIAKSGERLESENEIKSHLCAGTCSSAGGTEHNLVRFVELPTGPENANSLYLGMNSAVISISQPKETHSTVSYNNSPEIQYTGTGGEKISTPNVAYGTTHWLSPSIGAVEFKSHDNGLGVSETTYEVEGEGGGWKYSSSFAKNYLTNSAACTGVQCGPEQHEVLTYSSFSGLLVNGEHKIRVSARDPMEGTWSKEHGEGEIVVKVDSKAPHNLAVSGLHSKGGELELGEVEAHLKLEATDGEGTTPSAGVASLKLGIDGKEVGRPAGFCPLGPCTASAEWSINGAELGVGRHTLTMTATDNAGNVESKTYTLRVYHASPVGMGPGSVNPESGDFAMEATDVGVSGGTGSLAVTRHYDSRDPDEGEEGPLGPQWSVSLGSLASLEVLPDKGVMVVGPEGLTFFASKSGGGFESPVGDTNLTLTAEENAKKEIIAYLFKNADKGTTTKFSLPSGANVWMPTISEGPVATATDTTTDTYQTASGVNEYSVGSSWTGGITAGPDNSLWSGGTGAIYQTPMSGTPVKEDKLPKGEELSTDSLAAGSEGNVWFTTIGNIKTVGVISPSGKVTQYSLPGEKHEPEGITAGPDGNMWFTMRGWEGSGEYIAKVKSGTIEEYSLPGSATAITPGPNGEQALWFTDYSHGRIGRITTSGSVAEYQLPSGAAPREVVAGADGKLWYTDPTLNKIGTITTSGGGITEYALPAKSSPYGITSGPDKNLWFTDYESSKVGKITTSGSITEYSLPEASGPKGITAGSDGKLWFSESSTNKIGTITTSGVIVEPKLELAPHPSLTCSAEELEKRETSAKGCRALEFRYAKATTAKGENKSEWGEYRNRLMEVKLVAYNPSAKAVVGTPVAAYEYDSAGRLRAEWNPGVEGELKTTYGYNAEGQITALNPPGQESWVFTYGSILGDVTAGRLTKVTRAPASASLWKGERPIETEAPKLSGAAAVGARMAVTNGQWTQEPVAYGYQWEDCNSVGEACTPIPGATNANYTPSSSDVDRTLVAWVTATNGGGSVTVVSAPSVMVQTLAGASSTTVDSGNTLGAVACVPATSTCVVGDNKGKVFRSTNVSTLVTGTWGSWGEPKGETQAASCPTGGELCMLANTREAGSSNLSVDVSGKTEIVHTATHSIAAISCATSSFCLYGGKEGTFAYSTSPLLSWTQEQQGTANIKGAFCLSSSFCAMADEKGSVRVGTSTSQIKSSSWTETDVDGSTGLTGVACVSTTLCAAIDGAGNTLVLTIESSGTARVSKHDTDGANHLDSVSCTGSSICAAVDTAGNVFISKNGGETWSEHYKLGHDLTSVSCASSTLCATTDTTGEIIAFNPGAETSEGEAHSPQPGTTIEYNAPLEGSSAPQQMGVNEKTREPEPARWGQDDDPEYATAIFPPDKPQGWPASGYKRATVYYMDSQARTVNIAAPSGAVSTTEYENETNNVARTLSADNRAAAIKESCESKEHCKSAEVASLLATESKYNSNGQLLETLGPQHTVRLAHGKERADEEVLARNHVRYYYDEGAPEGEEYGLVTKTTDGAETASGEEFDQRTSTTSYNGQDGLGWKLRTPTSVTTDPDGLDLTSTTEYDANTGNVVATKSPAGTSQTVAPLSYSTAFGSEGSGNGQFKDPGLAAVDASGDVWVVDTENARIEKFSSSGSFIAAYGSKGTGDGQFSHPWGIAINQSTGSVFVSDLGNHRIEKFSEEGTFEMAIGWGVKNGKAELETCTTECKAGIVGSGPGQLHEPSGLAINANGDVWVVDEANDRVVEFSATGQYLSEFGSEGSGNGQLNSPQGIAISEGELYVADTGNSRIEEFSPDGSYLGQFGAEGTEAGQFRGPQDIAVNPNDGDLYVSDLYNNRIEEFTPAGKYLTEFGSYGSGKAHFNSPTGLAMTSTGDLYVVDMLNARVQKWLPPEPGGAHLTYSTQFGSAGSGEGEFNSPRESAIDGHGNLWVIDYNNHRIEKFSPSGKFIAAYGSWGSGNGDFEDPTGIDINQSTGDVYVADCALDRIQELSSTGTFIRTFGGEGSEHGQFQCPGGLKLDSAGNVWVTDSGNDRIEKFSSTGTFQAAYGSKGSGNVQFQEPWGITISGGNLYIADYLNDRIEEISTSGAYLGQIGFEGNGGGQFDGPETITTDAAGHLYVTDTANARVQELSTSGGFLASIGTLGSGDGQLNDPEGIAINAAGDVYVSDARNNRIEVWAPSNQAVHDTKTIYYTAQEEAEVETCRNHPEWAGLPCETEPAAQPAGPKLPVTTIAYNMWDQPETVTETFGSTTRTRKTTYDSAGRPLTSEETTTNEPEEHKDKTLPIVTDKYNTSDGALETQSTTVGEETKTITSKYNTLGQLVKYTDATGNITTYEYENGKDARLIKVTDAKGNQTYHYEEETTGFLTELTDSKAGTFKASYDVAGKMTSETYPNAMTANYTHNQAGETTGIEYVKTAHCKHTCPEVWYSDTIVPSIHGETLKQTSTLSEEPSYTYDTAGRLTQVQENPASEGCTTRIYAYDEESNRTSLTTRKPGTGGECATEGGTAERHTYDEANRLTDEGITYEPFGNTTSLPAADADGSELTSEYYIDGQVAKQEQNKETIEYKLDPENRTLEAISKGNTSATVISHYDGPGNALAWTSEETGAKWHRNIPGITGALEAVQTNEEEPILQLHDLQGDVIATVRDNENETELLTKYNSTEFGVPTGKEPPPKYAWLGAGGVAGELPSGVITQDGVTYVPIIGRPLQTESVPLPLPESAATPFSRPLEAWVGSKAGEGAARELATANEERQKREEANKPPGTIPLPGIGEEAGGGGEEEGGYGGGCAGDNACAASVHHGVHCEAQVYVGEEKGWIWSRAYMSCGGVTMPWNAYLQACLIQEDAEGYSPIASGAGWSCGYAVIGKQYPHQLYAHDHEECGLGGAAIFRAGAKFWLPGMDETKFVEGKHGYECGESALVATANFIWYEVETFAPSG
jgi:YD repeat-containing protein